MIVHTLALQINSLTHVNTIVKLIDSNYPQTKSIIHQYAFLYKTDIPFYASLCKLEAAILDLKDFSWWYHANVGHVHDYFYSNYPQKVVFIIRLYFRYLI